jgi:anti-sigma B factor antagonist
MPDRPFTRSPRTPPYRRYATRAGPALPRGALLRAVRTEEPMALPQLNVYRHDHHTRALITLAGEIDLATAPLVRAALAECLQDGILTVDVDLTAVTFCDASGLSAFLTASVLATESGATLQLHYPPQTMAGVIEITGSGFLLRPINAARAPSCRIPAAAGGVL